MQDLKSLLIQLDQVNKKIDKIQNDPNYIKKESERVFRNHKKRDHSKELNAIISTYL